MPSATYRPTEVASSPLSITLGSTKDTAVGQAAVAQASQILDVISRYRLHGPDQSAASEAGKAKFLAQIYAMVRAGDVIKMCLPAFPFKSPNAKVKVLGRNPDKAEEFALAHLNGMCAAIQDVYRPGARLTIVSDGLVYNDLFGVPDSHVWAYGEELRAMSVAMGFDNIEFARLRDLVRGVKVPEKLDMMTYASNATNFRLALLGAFGSPDFDADARIAGDEDVCLTYRGYIKFLETDLQTVFPVGASGLTRNKFKKGLGVVAKQMLYRGDAFARAVRAAFGASHIRLSIHASTGCDKISVGLLPTDTSYTTAWHCCIAFRLDGTTTTGPRSRFEADPQLELVHDAHGRPSFFRERSRLLSWAEDRGGIAVEPSYPMGLVIRPALGPGALSIRDVDADRVRALAEINSPVVLRGFAGTTRRDEFVNKAHELGTPLPWEFGLVFEVKDTGTRNTGPLDFNNSQSAEPMPFHYDGVFKTTHDENGHVVPVPPRFQFFTALTDSPSDSGFTLFSSSTLLFRYLPPDLDLARLRALSFSVATASFGGRRLRGLPMVIDHPTTRAPCLRYHEPWPQTRTAFAAVDVEIDDVDADTGHRMCSVLDAALRDRRVAVYHAWHKGDLVVADNVLGLHTRTGFEGTEARELWRVHFD